MTKLFEADVEGRPLTIWKGEVEGLFRFKTTALFDFIYELKFSGEGMSTGSSDKKVGDAFEYTVKGVDGLLDFLVHPGGFDNRVIRNEVFEKIAKDEQEFMKFLSSNPIS